MIQTARLTRVVGMGRLAVVFCLVFVVFFVLLDSSSHHRGGELAWRVVCSQNAKRTSEAHNSITYLQSILFQCGTMPSPPKPGYTSPKGKSALVTGSSGFVGSRLVEMLLERGATTVIAFDLVSPDSVLAGRFKSVQKKTGGKIIVLSQTEGDLCNDSAVAAAFQKVPKIDVVYHIAALVGPFHAAEKYEGEFL